jgi:hypothetical protein
VPAIPTARLSDAAEGVASLDILVRQPQIAAGHDAKAAGLLAQAPNQRNPLKRRLTANKTTLNIVERCLPALAEWGYFQRLRIRRAWIPHCRIG